MSLDCVSQHPASKAHAYHTVTIAERELIENFNRSLPGGIPRLMGAGLSRDESRQSAETYAGLLQTPGLDQRIDRFREEQRAKLPQAALLPPEEYRAWARQVLTRWQTYQQNCGGYNTGRGPGR